MREIFIAADTQTSKKAVEIDDWLSNCGEGRTDRVA